MTNYVNWLEWLIAMLTLILAGITGCAGIAAPTNNFNQDILPMPAIPESPPFLADGVGEVAVAAIAVLFAGGVLISMVRRKDKRPPPPRDYDPTNPP